ncbi:transporter substrate-binding domain-containing protein [Chelativorans sp. ZYF759]|jgi:polar amino acid transport system substrate-binding protein|uniref:transporter substrate-binding domain-containing protein n=1 Tax=Chelativorans sp. ZYF759 TaxID=2692213 RepID=UPI00145E2DF7|nr:transporter substrate-binding domain-containing protein [Chelativorans sp. ZYF759]NMG40138.1 transporter substrate-binding domain-containing protein [Chelativorans sp. ZYF759]
MKKLALTLAALAFGATSAIAQDVVRMGSEGAYPPYNFINDNNELDGFERELGDMLCERAELNCEWVINDWDTIIPNLVAGNYDTIMAGMSITEARQEVIAFTQNYLQPEPSQYVGLAGTDPSVIESGIVTTQSNTIQAAHVAETEATLVEFPTPDETIAAVRSGEADAVLADGAFLQAIVDESGGELEILGDPLLLGDGIGMGVRQSDDELRETFNSIISEMKEDGSLNELIVKWFGEEMPLFD